MCQVQNNDVTGATPQGACWTIVQSASNSSLQCKVGYEPYRVEEIVWVLTWPGTRIIKRIGSRSYTTIVRVGWPVKLQIFPGTFKNNYKRIE
jgi:hypothetical protein